MKKMYKQPIVEQAEMQLQSIICTSGSYGGESTGLEPDQVIELP